MAFSVVWKIGAPSRRLGVHAFAAPGLPGTRAVCTKSVSADGYPLGDPNKAPKCRACVGRLALMEEYGLDVMRENFSGLIRSRRLKEEAKKHWWIERHGGRRKDRWRRIWHGPQKEAQKYYASLKVGLTAVQECSRRRGGIRLVDPDGHIDCEFIRSPWMKEAAGGADVHEV